MRIGVLGTGRVGRSVGSGLARAGHEVVFGSRDPASSAPLDAPVVSLAGAAAECDVVVSAIPGSVALDTLRGIGRQALAGRTLIDIGNALSPDFMLIFPNDSLGAAIQHQFPETAVVKTLNTVTAPLMSNPGAIAPTNVFLSGDDEGAKTTVSGLLGDLGWSETAKIDLGGIETARGPEHYIFLSMALMRTLGTTSYGIAVQHQG